MEFDPYYTWLGIPPTEQPPNCYRLLGLAVFESNTAAIMNAAERQIAHLRQYQKGATKPYADQLIMQVEASRTCLLTPSLRQTYDTQLHAMLTAVAQQVAAGQQTAVAGTPATQLPDDLSAAINASYIQPRRKRKKKTSPCRLSSDCCSSCLRPREAR